ncbi:hypothetical protein BGZ63DRAFT_403244 [Mariannaea sp. PMI_226]|nr:hypothetical protein BGZ63DRAFT_403244 [Mariannaea sp. PMI_226]
MYRTSRIFSNALNGPSRAFVIRASPRVSSPGTNLNRRVTFYSSKSSDPNRPIGEKEDEKNARKTLKSHPSAVSTQSSVRHVMEESQGDHQGHDISAELKHDIGVVKETFRLKDVPRESRILGLVGTLPYLGTSLSTVFLSWDLNRQWPTGSYFYDSIFVDHETARYLLSVIEPIQLGYGAVIISFLGAIHWGLEYAEKAPHPQRTRFRYGIGLVSSVIAWPTIFMPIEYALTTQFLAFVTLYFVDSRAATRGWAPHWYGTYRFLLTAMVGVAIFVSLVGRAKIGQTQTRREMQQRMDTSGIADHKTDWVKLEKEEKERIRIVKKKAERKAQKEEQEKKLNELKEEKGHKQTDKGEDTGSQDSDKDEDKQQNEKMVEDKEEKDEQQDDTESETEKDDAGDAKKKDSGDQDS